jgi:hypothetical protein
LDSLIDMEHAIMQRSIPKPSQYVANESTSLPCPHVGVVRRIDHALDRLDWFAKRSLKALGQAYLDGLIAYGVAMHGFQHPIDEQTSGAQPADAPIWMDLSGTWLKSSPATGLTAAESLFSSTSPNGQPASGGRTAVLAARDTTGHAAVGRNADETSSLRSPCPHKPAAAKE